jgi:hypothetical protein
MYMGSRSFVPCFRDFECAHTILYLFYFTKATKKCLLKYVNEGRMEGRIEVRRRRGEDISSYWMTLRKREDTGSICIVC